MQFLYIFWSYSKFLNILNRQNIRNDINRNFIPWDCATSNVRKFASKMAKTRLVVCLSWSRQLLHSFPIPSFRLCHQRSARGGACSRSYLQICCSL